jgi:KaiC/GvpD/RAD55 family RecA-like ATPase
MEREKTGVKIVDDMIEGGIPRGSVVGLSGPPGAGKSILTLQFILEGARKGQKSVYINLGEPRKNIDNMIKEFDFADEFIKLEKKGLIIIKCFDFAEYEKIHMEVIDKIKENKEVKRVAIDSFNCFFDYIDKKGIDLRRLINDTFCKFREDDLTILLCLEKNNHQLECDIHYLADGIIELALLTNIGIVDRRIMIPKMRWTNQCKETKKYIIEDNGIVNLYKEEECEE